MPAALYLEDFAVIVTAAFGDAPYHVGSSLSGKPWRDVDVRLILSDAEYERLELGDPARPHENRRWVAFVKAFSALGREMTGLPIDFQIQQQTHANAEYSGPRSALGVLTLHLRVSMPTIRKGEPMPYPEERADGRGEGET